MLMRDYPLKSGGMVLPGNLWIDVRERGKLVKKHCRHEHNIWVDLGREYLARVVAPNPAYTDHHNEPPREFVRYVGVGIGGDSQSHPAAYTVPLSTDYPPATSQGGDGNSYDDEDLTIKWLERPVKINVGSPIWMDSVETPVVFLNTDRTLRLDYLFTQPAINSVGPYTVVPLSEIGLFLATKDPDTVNVYDVLNTPSMRGAGRQSLVAYNTFEPIPKTTSFSLEIWWELRF